jgi:2'-5' RNA ligase
LYKPEFKMNEIPEAPRWGFFALVTYIPDPLGSFLQELRKTLQGNGSSQAHITLLPPRELKVPVDVASRLVRTILRRFPAFDVELSKVRRFAETSFLYLDLTEGDSLIYELHAALNTGELADPEEFEFHPHLTLGGPVSPGKLDVVQEQAELTWDAAQCSPRFTIDEIVFLWLSPNSSQGEWRRLWTQSLSSAMPRSSAASAAVSTRTSLTGPHGQ